MNDKTHNPDLRREVTRSELRQPVKFYQTQTFTVGNRLVDGHARSVQANTRRTNSLNSGHRACQG
ncbi:MAG: hypothetical protein ACXWCS_29370, partial [Burkholderiales bacterium]